MAVPKLMSGGVVRIRLQCADLGTTKWREGGFEIQENKDGRVNLLVKFSSGGPPRFFQLNNNVKAVCCSPVTALTRMTLTLHDSNCIVVDQLPALLAKRLREYLDTLKSGQTPLKANRGGFGSVLGNHASQKECGSSSAQTQVEASPKKNREEGVARKPLVTPPSRTALLENKCEKRRILSSDASLTEDFPKENDSRKFLHSCKEKLRQSEESRLSNHFVSTPLQPTSFYGSRSGTREHPNAAAFDRSSGSSPCHGVKRSLTTPGHSTPRKKLRQVLDYGGWNRPRWSPSAPALQGFSNLGNTCYMNAILQSLFSLPCFSSDVLKQGLLWRRVPANALLRRFAHLLAKKDSCSSEVKRDLLRRVKSAISSTAERFSGYLQNDAHEFLSQCLDQIKEDVEKVNKSWRNESCSCENVPETCQSYTCPVTLNMEFEVQHTIVCKSCREVVTKCEQFNDLSIEVPLRKSAHPLRSIQDSLDLFFRMEDIEYSCEKCGGKNATVSHKFSRLPRVLILHLKRYSFNARLSLNSKLGRAVRIPRFLTLLAHCTDATLPPRPLHSRTLRKPHAVTCTSRKGSQKLDTLCDTDSEDELVRKIQVDEERTAELEMNGINDEEMLAAVLEMSTCPEDEAASSPDTGFGEDAPSLPDRDHTDLTLDENKENQTPAGAQGELEWMEQEREEQELQQALAQSLQEHEAREMREEDELKRATELSLQEFNQTFPEMLCAEDDSGNEDGLDVEYSQAESEELKRNAESGEVANSFRLISVVSHIGSSCSSGHYISDVYDIRKQSWLTYNDVEVSATQEASVQRDRDRSGYIFFYMHKDVFEELSELEKSGGGGGGRDGVRTVLQPI